jgi:hypothetical protein
MMLYPHTESGSSAKKEQEWKNSHCIVDSSSDVKNSNRLTIAMSLTKMERYFSMVWWWAATPVTLRVVIGSILAEVVWSVVAYVRQSMSKSIWWAITWEFWRECDIEVPDSIYSIVDFYLARGISELSRMGSNHPKMARPKK